MWPGDAILPAEETANCRCELEIEVRDEGSARIDSATAGNVARELGLDDDCNLSDVYDAYQDAMVTIGHDPATKWADLDDARRAAVLHELRWRDEDWIRRGKIPEPTFDPPELEAKKIASGKAHEIETARRVNKHGVRSDFVEDEVNWKDPLTGRMQTTGFADFADGTEIKTLSNASSYSTIDGYLKDTSGKENALRVIFDNSHNEAMSDEALSEYIRKSRRFKRGDVYVLTHEERLLKIR